jgi:hypothetical protein
VLGDVLRDAPPGLGVALTRNGHYPSTNRIAELLSDRNAMWTMTARSAWYEALSELGWAHDS